jgi:hypothetical protein
MMKSPTSVENVALEDGEHKRLQSILVEILHLCNRDDVVVFTIVPGRIGGAHQLLVDDVSLQ